MTSEVLGLSARETAARVRAGELSARRVTEAALAGIEETGPRVNAFIHIATQDALAQAERVDAAVRDGIDPGPLAGVPVSVKDLVHVAGMPTSFGSKVFAGQPAPGDAVPVARLRAAGAVILGKTTTPEFGHKAITESPLFGRTLNPWNRAFTSGGSSGGAAASVASRQVPLALGTDGGGSVRIPASACGVFGLKATLGAIPHIHAPDLFANNSYIGPLAHDLEDLRIMYRAMAGPDSRDPWSKTGPAPDSAAEVSTLRVGFALLVGNPAIEPQVAAAVEAAARVLSSLVANLRGVAIDFCRHEPHFRVLLESALASRLGSKLADERDRFDPSLVRTLEHGLGHSGTAVQSAASARGVMFREVEALFDEVDLIVTPTLAAASLRADTDTHADVTVNGVNCGRIRAGWYPYTWPLNLTGHPALSMPCGWTSDGLPVGLQLVGRWYAEDLLLEVAAALDAALGVEKRPWPRGSA